VTFHQQIFSLIGGFLILFLIIALIRARKLREEYSWLWLLTGAVIFVIVIWYDLLVFVTRLAGAMLPTTTLFILAILFLILINLFFSVKISSLADQIKNLAQEIAILKKEKHERKKKKRKK